MFGLETSFESTKPVPHNAEARPYAQDRDQRPQNFGLETYIAVACTDNDVICTFAQ